MHVLLRKLPIVIAVAVGLAACHRRQVDPTAMASDVGHFAFDFYQDINQGKFAEAALFFSQGMHRRYPQPESAPILAGRLAGRYGRVLADKTEIDWRHDAAYITVGYFIPVPDASHTTVSLHQIGKERHRWIHRGDAWFYDGPVQ